ncbi:MAG: hypothetical protein JXP39_09795 [Spirochaetales bacterium]|nr:hypothetical protein [Spirochaetales bacterium]
MEPVAEAAQSAKKKKFIVKSIFIAHAERIGWIRTLFGGFLQYVSVLEFIFLHLTTIIVLYKWILTPFFKLRKLRIRDFILLDRHKIEGMCFFDKINCEFCGYANGTARIWNEEIDEVAAADLRTRNPLKILVAGVYTLCLLSFLVFTFIFSKILYLFISLFLGMHRASTKEIMKGLKDRDYAGRHGAVLRFIIRVTKVYASSLALNLEQIESSWCPLKHSEREGNVYSEHHDNFYPQDKLAEVVEVLGTVGTVSDKKPKY